jgi:hypothetical protein
MRATQTGTGKGQIIGIASIDFYAARDRRINGCTVHWDSDPGFIPLLPAVAFDEYLPNLRLIHVNTEAGEGVIVGEDAQRILLGEFEEWLAAAHTHLNHEGELPLYAVVPLVDEHEPPGDVVAQTEFTVRINVKKERLWGECKHTPEDVTDVVFSLIPKMLWDWVVAVAPQAIEDALFLDRMSAQAAYYQAHGIPSDFRLREIGRAPFAVWRGTAGIPLDY